MISRKAMPRQIRDEVLTLYAVLDGTVPVNERHAIAENFNNDPGIDVLLLTTSVGGEGLNLTGADVVIFVEHDWNPVKDLQAMDRAHRIGQKRTVNVYRLITEASIEQKIMRFQKFKTDTANVSCLHLARGSLSFWADNLTVTFTLLLCAEYLLKSGRFEET
uniref:Helicase C-terminal domain-containing protein n=1 Tax=Parascaris equorum TaxID=6256 RepID=A0A914SGQ8_PAREQ